MTKAEIEFLRAAGFTLTEIMAMNPAPADPAPAPADPAPAPANPAPAPAPADPAPAPANPAPAPADPAPAPAPADPQNAMLEKLDKILAAVQAGNRAGAQISTPAKKTPEEIAGQLY